MPTSEPQPSGAPLPVAEAITVRCSGCGSVLAAAPGEADGRAACRRLFEETVRGLREEAGSDPQAARTAALADVAYAAQHPDGREPGRLSAALAELAGRGAGAIAPAAPRATQAVPGATRDAPGATTSAPGATTSAPGATPAAWTTTIADVAADLDVIDLTVLVEAWAATVADDWRATGRLATPPTPDTERS